MVEDVTEVAEEVTAAARESKRYCSSFGVSSVGPAVVCCCSRLSIKLSLFTTADTSVDASSLPLFLLVSVSLGSLNETQLKGINNVCGLIIAFSLLQHKRKDCFSSTITKKCFARSYDAIFSSLSNGHF